MPARRVIQILFIGAEDWLFALRHLPLLRAARELGLRPVVVVREGRYRRSIEQAGARVLALPGDPASRRPAALWRHVTGLKQSIAGVDPAIVQFQGLRPALFGGVAAQFARVERRVCALNGLGRLASGDGPMRPVLAQLAAGLQPLLLGGPLARIVFDNPDEAALLPLGEAGRSLVRLVPGKGVDPLIHMPEPMPWSPPLKLVFGSPLLWSNGPDLAVEALGKARAAGAEVTLSLIGAPCRPGAAAVPEAVLREWSRRPGVSWFAPTADVAQIWRQHHGLVLPSHGGDGLPAIVTEAAAAGRPILASDVEGCRSFIRDGIEGRLVPRGDTGVLAEAMVTLARAPGLVERMGRAARERVLDGHTERDVMDAYKRIWSELLGLGATP